MPPLRKYIAYVLGDAIPTALAADLPPNLHAKFHLDRSSRLGASQTHTDRRPSSADTLGCAASKSSAAAFVAKFLVQPPPPKKKHSAQPN